MSDFVRIEASIPREEWEAYQRGDISMDAIAPEWREAGEAMVRRAALEWLAVHVAWWSCVTPCPHGYVPNSKDECGHEPEECWVTAALKAAEEAES